MTWEPNRTDWPEAMATVLSCRYHARAGRALAFGLTSSRHFHIMYNYWVDGELHRGECFTEKALPVGTLFPIRYDPELPHRSNRAHGNSTRPRPLVAVAIAGGAISTLALLGLLRGC